MSWSRALLLPCLLVVAPAGPAQTPAQAPAKPAKADQKPAKDEKTIPPVILLPQTGDTVGTTVTVSGTSTCWPVILTITPTTGSPQTHTIQMTADGTWSHSFTVAAGGATITACCSPSGPCSSVTVTVSTAPVIQHPVVPVTSDLGGNFNATGRFVHTEAHKQAVYVFLEKDVITDLAAHRRGPVRADLDTSTTPATFSAAFMTVPPGKWIVRPMLIGRGQPVATISYVVEVAAR